MDDQKFRFYPEKTSFVTIAENECVVKYYVPKITEPPLQKNGQKPTKERGLLARSAALATSALQGGTMSRREEAGSPRGLYEGNGAQ